jgi:hypothetical protein
MPAFGRCHRLRRFTVLNFTGDGQQPKISPEKNIFWGL